MPKAYCLSCGKLLPSVLDDYCDDCEFFFQDEDVWWEDEEDWDDDEDDPFVFMPEDF